MKFGVWTRSERAFLEGRDQERGNLLNQPEGGPSTSKKNNPADAIYDGSLKLKNTPNDNLSHSVIATNSKGNSVLLVKTNNIYSVGFYNSALQTETYSNYSPVNDEVFIKFLENVAKLGPIYRVNFVNAEPPINEEVAGKIINAETLFISTNVSFGKKRENVKEDINNLKDINYLKNIKA